MELIKEKAGSAGNEGEVWFSLFNKYIGYLVEDSADISYVRACAEYLNNLPETTVLAIFSASIRYCNSFLDAIGEPVREFPNPHDIKGSIFPSLLIIPNPQESRKPALHLELNCDWEIEHGMEWVIRDDRVLYVGAFNGEDAWDDFSQSKEYNYA
ncbi:MAG: hypothetical protein F9K24_01020 [Leptonema illini]|uniref:DUF6985 domain-containing protein n=1 Tax=Leptonema illini TaxID=183 RepID=A0A833H5A5_9LEPT|nr:MAG: hypothetical protein F9K24_01020 [Leptonema illini]